MEKVAFPGSFIPLHIAPEGFFPCENHSVQ